MRQTFLLPLLGLCSLTMEVHSKRVLVIPMPFTSHSKFHVNIARGLTKLGHRVWVAVPDYVVSKNVLDTTNLTVVEYRTKEHVEEKVMEGFRDNFFRGENDDWLHFLNVLIDYTDEMLTNGSFFHEVRALQPEFVIMDNIPSLRVLSIIPYRLGIPFAFAGVAYDPVSQRIPFSLATSPAALFVHTDRMTWTQKLLNSFVFLMSALHDFSTYADSVSRYAPEMPYLPLDMLVAKADLWLVETDHIMDYPRPSLPNVKLIGGTATGLAKPLSPPYSSFMDSAHQGVVIISFGSYVLDLPKAISDKILNVLLELPFKAVFRSNRTSPDPEKILTASWIPQNDLLGHKNTKVFVSHGGNSGQYEALFHAVPVVSAPIFSDQPYNAERLRTKGYGETVDIRSVSAEELRDTILKVAFNQSYKDRITKASEIFKIEFGVPVEKAAFWLNHVMKYGGEHLRSAGHDLPYYQFLGLDIILCFLGFFSAILSLFVGCLYTCLRCLLGKRKQKTE